MCNCKKLKKTVFDLDSNWIDQAIAYQGRDVFPEFFAEFEAEEFEPALSYSEFYYCCKTCSQAWYLECASDEVTFPLFGIKLQGIEQRLSKDEVDSQKQFIILLAHNGFGSGKCRQSGCNNYKLNGKELCHHHLAIL